MDTTKPKPRLDISDLTGIDLEKIGKPEVEEIGDISSSLTTSMEDLEKKAEEISGMARGEKKKRAIILLEQIKDKIDATETAIGTLNANVALIPDVHDNTKTTKWLLFLIIVYITVGFAAVMYVVL